MPPLPRATTPGITTRRSCLAHGVALGGLWLTAPTVRLGPSQAADPEDDAEDGDEVLVVIELAGGNDGLSTIVPWADDIYHAARTTTRLRAEDVLRIDDYRGFHPALKGLRRHYDAGHLALVEGVGYPRPNRSHFASFDIWHAADVRGRGAGDGWLARLICALYGPRPHPNRAIHIGRSVPFSLRTALPVASCFISPRAYTWARAAAPVRDLIDRPRVGGSSTLEGVQAVFENAGRSSDSVRAAVERYRPRVEYPQHDFGSTLRTAAALIQEGVGVRVLSVPLGGFDTHVQQRATHDTLMEQLDGALSAFLDDLGGTPRGDRTVVLVHSEFGRRVAENASRGTDHGVAGPLFVAGARVQGGKYGVHPSLVELDEGDLIHTTDFRRVYRTLVEGVFGLEPESVLLSDYPALEFLA